MARSDRFGDSNRSTEESLSSSQARITSLLAFESKLRGAAQTKETKQKLKELQSLLKQEELEKLNLQEKLYKEQLDAAIETNDFEAAEQAKRHLKDIENTKKTNALKSKASESINKAMDQTITNIKSSFDKITSDFIATQESMAYGLSGSNKSFSGLVDTLNQSIGATGIVKQQRVYENLNSLVKSGILYNVEQRAFLQTLSDDLGMMFNATDGTLTRLINLQRKDLSDERVAIEASLKEYLNQNYQTSQYIKDGFTTVSNALIEAQATMDSPDAMQLEAVVQQWLGSLSSVGLSSDTISSIATAIGNVGSGNLSALSGSPVQNLVIMGAAESGTEYARILTEGLSPADANSIMAGIVKYLSSISTADSNVVKSAYADIFGLKVSDLRAIANLDAAKATNITAKGLSVTTDITSFMNKVDSYINATTKFDNTLSNLMYGWATNFASDNPANYMAYKITDMISQAVGSMVDGTKLEIAPFGAGVSLDLGTLIKAAPLALTVPSLIGSLSGVGKMFGGASSIYNSLSGEKETGQLIGTGTLSEYTKLSGLSTSGSLIYSNTDTEDIYKAAKSSGKKIETDTKTGEETDPGDVIVDIKELVQKVKTDIEDLPNHEYAATVKFNEDHNSVRIGNDYTYVQDAITAMAINVQNIMGLLIARFSNQNANLIDTNTLIRNTIDASSYNNINDNLGWLTSPSTMLNNGKVGV